MCTEKTSRVRFYLFLVGVVLTLSGAYGVVPMVSSLNVEEAIGSLTLAIGYAIAIPSTFLVPTVAAALGVRAVVVIAATCYLLFVLGNVYTAYYTLIPAAVFFGVGDGWYWSSGSIVANNFAVEISKNEPGTYEKRRRLFTGIFFAASHTGTVFGSAASVVFLFVDRQLSGRSNFTTNRDFSFCGANDCQDPNITLANIEQYTPAFVATRYSLIAFLAGLILIAVILYRVSLPVEARPEVRKTTNTSSDITRTPSNDDAAATANQNSTPFQVIAKSLKSTLKLLITPKHLLIMWLAIYGGMTLSFFNGEITRAFVSCVLGVDKVGVAVILLASGEAMTAYVGGKVNSKHGRNYPFAFAFVLDVSSYVVCLNWQITENTTWVIYILSFMFGMSDGLWQSQTNEMYGSFFRDDNKQALAAWNIMYEVGLATQFAISKALCVWQKIYLQIALMAVAGILYSVAYYIFVWRLREENISENRTGPSSNHILTISERL
ncbi:unnamed protein product [Clavelina lepadiformis]|uniref:Protein unc-93 homolog A n=1 Tax=Clavelina lepadiformis TaxID=159417 RepID=A0ABP0FL61_CLALP